MFTVLKISCLVIYALGAASALGLLPESLSFFGVVALLLLAAHVAEVFLMFKHVRRYQGPLAVSVLLTVLFGVVALTAATPLISHTYWALVLGK